MKLFKINKKGFLDIAFEIILALLVLFVGIALMSTFSMLNKGDRENLGRSFMNEARAENNIAVYLKQPVKIDGKTLTMTDLIVLAALNKGKYKQKWDDLTEHFFSVNEMKVDITVYSGEKKVLSQKVVSEFWKAAKSARRSVPGYPTLSISNWITDLLYKDESRISTFYLPSSSGPLKFEVKKYYSP